MTNEEVRTLTDAHKRRRIELARIMCGTTGKLPAAFTPEVISTILRDEYMRGWDDCKGYGNEIDSLRLRQCEDGAE